jgi:hypothetical protein
MTHDLLTIKIEMQSRTLAVEFKGVNTRGARRRVRSQREGEALAGSGSEEAAAETTIMPERLRAEEKTDFGPRTCRRLRSGRL